MASRFGFPIVDNDPAPSLSSPSPSSLLLAANTFFPLPHHHCHPNLSTSPTIDLPLLPHISFSSSPHRQRRYPHSSHMHLIPFPVSLSLVPVSLSHNKPPSSVIFSVGLPSPVPALLPSQPPTHRGQISYLQTSLTAQPPISTTSSSLEPSSS
ncbi:hypothetical protein OIU79_001215 [Salix purpurea]|uniref:Uncharacterized protein n=1 Tax=Salix purpurea TaxID=77065 RepID=A0A9Q0ZNR4_SALPP|nr:hypothetical protein OIU79_001215 [Salix purpurea]